MKFAVVAKFSGIPDHPYDVGIVERRVVDDTLCTSYWLQDAIKDSKERDILDALADAELLVRILKERLGR